jgi:magnesium transporter
MDYTQWAIALGDALAQLAQRVGHRMPRDRRAATRALSQEFLRLYPDEAARILETVPAPALVAVLEAEPAARGALLLEALSPAVAAEALARVSPGFAGRTLPALDPARAAALLGRLDEDVRERWLALVDAGTARELRTLMTYPADTAGHLMDPRAPVLRAGTTVRDALTRLRAARGRGLQDACVIDTEGRLTGVVALHELAAAAPGDRLETLERPAPRVHSLATREEVVELLTGRKLASLPVVDLEDRLLGVIRHDALVAAAREEASADLLTMVGASKEERALSGPWFAVRNRLPWLQINLGTAFLAAAVVGLFESTIARFTALAVLLPVVAGPSGNTGAQALAVTMRGLALREVRPRHRWRVCLKELNAAFLNGVAVALTTALGVHVWSGSAGLAFVIGISMVISMIAAGLAGAAIPMLLGAAEQDPAQSSSLLPPVRAVRLRRRRPPGVARLSPGRGARHTTRSSSASEVTRTPAGGSGWRPARSTSTPRRPAAAAPARSSAGESPTCAASAGATRCCARAARKMAGSGLTAPIALERVRASNQPASPSAGRSRSMRLSKLVTIPSRRPRSRRAARAGSTSG